MQNAEKPRFAVKNEVLVNQSKTDDTLLFEESLKKVKRRKKENGLRRIEFKKLTLHAVSDYKHQSYKH
jgi:hypothetical protein